MSKQDKINGFKKSRPNGYGYYIVYGGGDETGYNRPRLAILRGYYYDAVDYAATLDKFWDGYGQYIEAVFVTDVNVSENEKRRNLWKEKEEIEKRLQEIQTYLVAE